MAGYGFSLASLASGFAIGLLADMKYGWDKGNYIIFLDANTYSGMSKEQLCPVIMKKMNKSMQYSLDDLQNASAIPLNDGNKFSELKNNGGDKICYDGYALDSRDQAKGEIYTNSGKPYLGSKVNVSIISQPISSDVFYDEIKSQLPSSSVIAIRYNYETSMLHMQGDEKYQKHGLADPNLLYTSPLIKLPKATFISLPVKELIGDKEYIKNLSAIRDNKKAYYFITPVDGVQVTSTLDELHQRGVTLMEEKLSKLQ